MIEYLRENNFKNEFNFSRELTNRLSLRKNDLPSLTTKLSRNLIEFHRVLIETPIISPWNGDYEFGETDFMIANHEIDGIMKIDEVDNFNSLVVGKLE